jgi:hypothetical protein
MMNDKNNDLHDALQIAAKIEPIVSEISSIENNIDMQIELCSYISAILASWARQNKKSLADVLGILEITKIGITDLFKLTGRD